MHDLEEVPYLAANYCQENLWPIKQANVPLAPFTFTLLNKLWPDLWEKTLDAPVLFIRLNIVSQHRLQGLVIKSAKPRHSQDELLMMG